MNDSSEHKAFLTGLVEALLFASSDPVTLSDLTSVLNESTKENAAEALEEIITSINNRSGGIKIVAVAGGYQLVTRPEYAPYIRKLKTVRAKTRLSKAACEVLAIIAYRQPVTLPEIDYIRGVDSSGVIRNLIEKDLVSILGKKHAPGNPILYGTSKKFLLDFGISDLKALPELKDLETIMPGQRILFDDNIQIPDNLDSDIGNGPS
ncbi:SMC-Scp complex subunit ScpB [bacterium]|nr:SMC-Scp complex subunit ScpB [candidate division CSSED10-310 bacterium]